MKNIYSRLRLPFLVSVLTLLANISGFAQCSIVLQGGASTPTCNYQAVTGGSGAYWTLPVTGGVNYSFYWGASGCADNDAFCVNGFTSTAASGSPFTASAAATGSWDIGFHRTSGGWCGTSATLNYKITSPTASPGATTTATVCASANVYTIPAGYSSTIGSISWSTNGDGTFTNGNTLTPTYNFGTVDRNVGGAKTLTMTVNNGGCTATTTFTLTIRPAPSITAGTSSATVCVTSGSYTVTGYSTANGTISWASSGDGTFTNGTTANPTYTFGAGDISSGGVKNLTMTVTNSPCTDATSVVALTLNKVPGATQGATNTATVCASSNTYAIPAGYTSANGTINWTSNGDGTFTGGNTLTPTYNFGVNDKANGGLVTLTMNVTNAPCTAASATFGLTIDKAPSAASVAGTIDVCGSLTSGSLGATPPAVGSGTWTQFSGPGTTTFSNASSASSTATVTVAGTYVYTWTVSNGVCPSNSANETVNFYTTASTATVGPTQNVCGVLTSTSLGGNTPASGTGTWSQTSGPGTSTFSNANDGAATATVSIPGTYVFTWTITSGSCTPSSASLTVNYYPAPTTATAGPQQNLCAVLTSGPLGGNTPVTGTGTWSQLIGTGSSIFSNANDPASTATASVPGTYIYAWTITTGPGCNSVAYDTVNYYATPTTASVGGDQNVCGTLTSGNLGGNSPAIGTGTWSQTSGPGTTTFSNPNAPSANATASIEGTYVYTWTITNGTCPASSASLTVNFYATPTTATVGPTQNVCGALTSGSLGGNTPTAGTGTWTQTSGPGTTTFSNATDGASTATASVVGTYVYTWTISNGTCTPSAASITVNYYANPTTATVGADQDICGAVLISNPLGGNTPTVGTGTWTQTSGPGVTFFSAPNSGSSNASVSVQGTYVFTWTIANGACTSSASVTVNYYSPPTIATVGATQNLCGTLTSNSLGGNTAVIGTGAWSQLAGPGTTTFSNVNDGAATATASVTGSYTYQWTISNGTCTPSSAMINVNFIPSPTGGTIANSAFCAAIGSGSVSVTGVSNANQYQWALPAGLSGSSTGSSISVGGSLGGTYTVTVTPQNAIFGVTCSGTPITGIVTILSQPVIDSINAGAVSCFGGSDDTIRVYAHTNNGSLFYSVDGGTTYPNSTGFFPGLAAGTYNVIVQDDSLCATSYSNNPVVVTAPADIFLSIASFDNVRCNGDSSGFINITASGGTGAITFLWSNGATSQNISHLGAANYTVAATDAHGCTRSVSQLITEPAALIVDSIRSTNISCYNANDGTAAFYVSGGVPGYTYLWSNSFTTPTVTGLNGGNYSVTATDNNGCRAIGFVNIVNPLPVALSLTATNVACFGAGNGSITANVTGGSGTYTYTWSPAVSTTSTATNVGPGTYVVTATDVNGCTDIDSITITQPISTLAAVSLVTPVGCTGESHGAIQLLVSGGVGGYTYLWSPGGQTVSQISGLSAGNYSATVTDGNGCQVSVFDTLVDPAPIVSSVSGTSATCAGAGGGSATLTVSGGVPGYTYLWSNFETTKDISNLSGGLYRVVITDTIGCQHRDSIVISQPQAIVVTLATTSVGCAGGATGSVIATVTGGTGSYTYTWTPNVSTTDTARNVLAGSYTVVVTDSLGCTGTATAVVTQIAPLSLSVAQTNVLCYGDSNGTVNITVAGGTGSYTYVWSPAVSTTSSATGLAAGTYAFTVNDASGCSLTGSTAITQPASPIILTNIVHNVTCFNGHDGSIFVAAQGGTGAYTYVWSNGDTTQYITGLSMATPFQSSTLFSVTVTDANGCELVQVDTLRAPGQLLSSIAGTDVTCAGARNGSAVLTVTGGVPGYTYLWSNFATTKDLTNVAGAAYTVLITDSNGCRRTDTITIQEPQPIVVSLSSTNINCNGAANGTITATVTGGTGAYTYTWTPNVSTTSTATGLAPGTYTVAVNDTNGCTQSATVTITQPASAVLLSVAVTDITCHDANNGSISTQVSGGSGSYTYAWTGSSALSPSISGLSAGSYTVTVRDANGCTATGGGTITNPTAITSTVTGTNVTCAGQANGTATVATVAGGTAPYTYLWTNFAVTQSTGNLSGGIARVIITDAHGCQHRDSIIITEPTPLTGTITSTNIGCAGGNTGSVTVSVTGGTGAYTYTWNPNVSNGPSATSLAAGTYHVTVADANGCTYVDSATVSQPTGTLAAIATVSDMTCHDANDGSITISASGGTGSYTYAWTGGLPATPTVTGLAAGTYTVTVTDAGGCIATATGTITNPAAITSTVTGTNVTCAGAANGTATVATVAGGTAPYTYLWSNFAATQTISGLSGPQLARVIIRDAHGCEHRDSLFISEPQPVAVALAVTQISCNNLNDGAITANGTGGTGTLTYQWAAPGSQTTATISGLTAGTYTVTVKDANNCQTTATATIVNPAPLSVATVVINPRCNGANNGTVTLIVNGGTQQYNYTWSGSLAGSGQSAINVAPGAYYVTVTDAHGCTATDSAKVVAPSPIFVSAISSNVSCNGRSDGSVIATVYGGALPYSYQWTYDSLGGAPGPITKDWTQLSGGDYYLAITDANGCQASFHAVIREADSLRVTLSKTDLTCFDANNGKVLASATGGTTPYHYLWSNNFATDSTQTGLAAGNYAVVVTDSNGCQVTRAINVAQPQAITITLTSVNPACAGSATGTITAQVSGGTGAYGYTWSTVPQQNGQTATGLSAGKFYVTVTDANGCSQVDSATLTAPQALVVNTAVSNPTCSDGNNGFVSLDVHQGTAPYTYNWNTTPAQFGNVASGLTAGTYIATITDAGGCQMFDTALVVAPLPITITIGTLGGTTCINSTDGYAVVNVTGGLAPYTYQLGSLAQASDTFRNLAPGSYALTVIDANGCQAVISWTIVTSSSFSVDLTVDRDVILAGETIQLTATATSDTTVTGYTWTTQDSSINFTACGDPANCPTPTATPQNSTVYLVQAVNARGCVATDTVHVTVSREESAFMPSAFTPNGDGLNDRLEFDILGGKTLDVQIWNRWGEKVFSDPAQVNGITGLHGWDGTFRGKVVEFDNYTYQVVVTYNDGHQKTIAGTITVMR